MAGSHHFNHSSPTDFSSGFLVLLHHLMKVVLVGEVRQNQWKDKRKHLFCTMALVFVSAFFHNFYFCFGPAGTTGLNCELTEENQGSAFDPTKAGYQTCDVSCSI